MINVAGAIRRRRGMSEFRSFRDLPGPNEKASLKVPQETLSTISYAMSMAKGFVRALEKAKRTGEVDDDVLDNMRKALSSVSSMSRAKYGY